MFSINSKEDKFYTLFVSTSEVVNNSAKMLREFMGDLSNSEKKLIEIKEWEHKGDQKQHEILEQLNKTFLTPIDREDIYLIAKNMDDIIDFIDASACRFNMYNINKATDQAIELCNMIVESTKVIIEIMNELKSMKTSKKLAEKIIEVNRIEEEGDRVYRQALKELFSKDIPVIEVIKWKDIYEFLEYTLDACEEVANIVEGVVMKNA